MKGFLAALMCLFHQGSARVVKPGVMDEVCEGEKIVLRCPPPASVVFGDPSEIQWGRNGAWEPHTACGKADVSKCRTVSVKKKLSDHCRDKSECEIPHGKQINSRCPARKGYAKPKNYLTVKYSCINLTPSTTIITSVDKSSGGDEGLILSSENCAASFLHILEHAVSLSGN